jgi:hypothetical protein
LFVELKFYFLIGVILLSGTMGHIERWIGGLTAAYLACLTGRVPSWVASATLFPFGAYFLSGCLFYLIRSRGLSAFRVVALVACCALATIAVRAQSGSCVRR